MDGRPEKRVSPLNKIDLPLDEALRRAMSVPPPVEPKKVAVKARRPAKKKAAKKGS